MKPLESMSKISSEESSPLVLFAYNLGLLWLKPNLLLSKIHQLPVLELSLSKIYAGLNPV